MMKYIYSSALRVKGFTSKYTRIMVVKTLFEFVYFLANRNLHLSGQSKMKSNNCQYLLKWTLPRGVYADPYQLQFFIQNQTLHFVSNVNIESMAHNSHEIVFYTFEKPACREMCEFSKSIPLHSRYHSPSMKQHTADLSVPVNLVPPSVYSSCSDCASHFDENEPSCKWKKMKSSVNLQGTHMSVPVGDVSQSVFVAAITLLTTIGGTVYLAKEI